MKPEIIKLNQLASTENTIESCFNLVKFITFLQDKVTNENSSRKEFYQLVLAKLHLFPLLDKNITYQHSLEYETILELVTAIVLPLAENEEETLMALTNASSMEAFYSSNAFHRLLKMGHKADSLKPGKNEKEELRLHKEFQYFLILKHVYGHEMTERNEMVHGFLNASTGLYQYFRSQIDTRFVDVKIRPGIHLPDSTQITSCFNAGNPSKKIQALLSVTNFTASGFCVVSLTDITAQQAIEQIAKDVVRIDPDAKEENFTRITRLLQTIIGSSSYRFGIMPFFMINERAALPYENFNYSIVVKICFDGGVSKNVFSRYVNHYIKNPQRLVYHAGIAPTSFPVPVQKALEVAGIHYYALLPVHFNNALVGIFEIASGPDVAALTDFQAARLKPAIPHLAQLMVRLIEKFNMVIDGIIKDKFTNIQPAVQWKFNEVAWHYFRSHDIEHKNSALENISFREVHPLYGAVDIRDSTIERNRALREDLEFQLTLLIELLTLLHQNGQSEKLPVLAEKCRTWLKKMQAYVSVEEELELNDFLYAEVHPLLSGVEGALSEEPAKRLSAYHEARDKRKGQAYLKRRQLENSIRKLNTMVVQYFDLFGAEVQANYPCYFEKFRTDGVEYDIYIGQSITPGIPFSFDYVKRLRLWQVQSMAAIANLTYSLLPRLEYPLQTTQLIFVNSRSIDISFRNDERRFDVEGAYNIRYHIVKKRIDKVRIKNSQERLTQPGKIAIVYFSEKDAAGYIQNILQLQEEGILKSDLEYLELEELQGVAGLHALRVGVQLQSDARPKGSVID